MDPSREDAIHNERHVKVICVGAGASGLCLAYKLQRSFRSYSLTIYEKNPDVSGTWYENRYPGCACDVPSHNYVYSFEPKPDWSSVYAGSSEIRSYFQNFASKYGLWKHIRTSHTVTATRWSEADGMWAVEATDLTTGLTLNDTCHILVHATGYLNNPAWPNVPGLDAYAGTKLHSANYDDRVSLHGKDVLLIGGGSSAVQILPAIQPIAKSVKIFIRSPVWVLPDISNEAGQYSREEIDNFVNDAASVQALRQNNERTMNSIFTVYLKDSFLQKQCKELLVFETKKILQSKEMEEKLIPDFPVGCKRVVPSGFKYIRALKKENVTVVHGGVASFSGSGCISDDGHSHEGDVIICATGFNTSYVPRYPIIGPNSRNLQAEWAESIMGYMGVGISEFPNTFTMLGPYTPVSNGPTMIAIEAQADYICSFIDRYQTEPIHSMALKQAACADFKAQVTSFMDKAVWTGGCRNSHNNHSINGRTPTTWPGSTLHYLEAMREPRFDDWEITYSGNRFSWLGIGVSQTEWDPTSDLGYYIKQTDDGCWNSRWKRNLAIAKTGSMPARQLHRQPKLALDKGISDNKGSVTKENRPAGNLTWLKQVDTLLSSLGRMLNSVLPRFFTGGLYRTGPSPVQYGSNVAQHLSSAPAPTKSDGGIQVPLDHNSRYWKQTAGNMLRTLLHEAGYSDKSKAVNLDFFERIIIPSLGAALDRSGDGVPRWKSYMTDDHNPIELSWDWHTGDKRPTIRFSMEPVSASAGTKTDPDNKLAGPIFREMLTQALPTTNMEWFNHFDKELNQNQPAVPENVLSGQPSQIFYAFDLGEEELTSKAYFFPSFMAKATNQTELQVLSQTIRSAPGCSDNMLLEALKSFEDFANDESTPPLEMDILAIDMVDPAKSRLKIYLRNRETSFASVRQVMTLGNRASDQYSERGLQNLRKVWNAVLLQDGVPENAELPELEHRTGGILYNIELRPGSKSAKLKIYIPARHYGKSDKQIVTALHEYMYGSNGQSKGMVMPNFPNTLSKIFNEDALQGERGIQTAGAFTLSAPLPKVADPRKPPWSSLHISPDSPTDSSTSKEQIPGVPPRHSPLIQTQRTFPYLSSDRRPKQRRSALTATGSALVLTFSPSLRTPVRYIRSKNYGPGKAMRTQSGLGGSRVDSGAENSANVAAWDREFLDGGRERGARRKKVYGYLKAANELRQTYSAQLAQKYQDSEFRTRMPGDFPDFDNDASGNEEIMLFPSYGRKINKKNRKKLHQELSSKEYGHHGTEELAYWEKEWDEHENENAIVDVDVRGWIFSPHRGPLNRKNRILLSLARRLSGIPTTSQTSDSDDEASDQGWPSSFAEKQDEDFANKRAESIIRRESVEVPKQPTAMTADQIAAANAQLMERLRPFLTIPMAGTPATVFFFNDTQSQSRTVLTNDSGQFALRASLDFIPTQVRVLAGEDLSAVNEVKILAPAGVSLISDVDDTIKHSAISEGAREMFRNTFVRDLDDLTIAGVKEWYTKLAEMGVGIHYVSNSPWQLYPLLEKYFSLTGLPPGSFHLKQYSGMLQGILEPTAERKRPSLERIIQDFPDRQFVLVGDSGEADLEIYTELVLANPGRILGIFIRDVTTPSVSKFFDKSVSQVENTLSRQFARAGLSDGPDAAENKPSLPPRRYLEQSNPKPEPPTTRVGNLIDLDDDGDDYSPSLSGTGGFSQQKPTSSTPARPAKPVGLRGTNIEQTRAGDTNSSSQSTSTIHRKPVPVPPKKPAILSSVVSEARAEPSIDSTSTKPSGQLYGQGNSEDRGYAASLMDQAADIYNRLPSAKEYVGNMPNLNPLSASDSTTTTRTKPIPPPAPPPRRSTNHSATQITASRSTSNLLSTPPPAASTRSYEPLSDYDMNRSNPSSSSISTPQRIRTPTNPINDPYPSLPPNKHEELWNRRWARANDILRREGVVLASWRVGGDVQELCFRLVKNAQEDIKQAGG